MKAEFEIDSDCLANKIAQEVVKLIKPLLAQGSPKDEGLFTVETFAKYLRVSTQWVYERVHLKEIPHFKVGKHVRFKKSDIDTWLDSLKIPPMSSLSSVPKSLHNPKQSKVTT